MDAVHMVPLVTVPDPFEAKVIAARLGAEGIVWELRGNVDSVYPVGGVQVLVDVAHAAAALEIIDLGIHEEVGPVSAARSALVVVALVVLVLVVLSARTVGAG